MKPGKIFPLFCAALALGLFSACNISRTTRTPITHYTLEYQSPRLEQRDVLPCVVMLKRFSVSPGLQHAANHI